METKIVELMTLQNKVINELIEFKESMIKNALIEKGFNPDDHESLKGHLNCKIYTTNKFVEHYYMDETYLVSINTEWKRN